MSGRYSPVACNHLISLEAPTPCIDKKVLGIQE